MKKMEQAFQEFEIKTIPSAANFITLVFPSGKEAHSFNEKMLYKGIILRHLTGWGLPNCVRLTVGTKEENKYVMKSIYSKKVTDY
jgi:histidinol-phosphate aminotransferase